MDNFTAKHLKDILECINAIESYTYDLKSFSDYQKSRQLRRSVEREIEIISEAISRINERDINFEITESKLIKGMRNRIAHAYDSIDDAIVYNAVVRHLPLLKKEIETLLS